MAYTKNDILSHLKEFRDKNDALIEKAKEDITTERFMKSTVTGGAFANAARSACDTRISKKQNEISGIEEVNNWIKEMLRRYA